MMKIRDAAVSGTFYPNDEILLKNMIDGFFQKANSDLPIPKAIISPHAGFIYSGPIAASAFACFSKNTHNIKHVVILGPAHQHPFYGIALTQADYYKTPLGLISVCNEMNQKIIGIPKIHIIEEAFLLEHSLEMQIPFIQTVLPKCSILPILVSSTADIFLIDEVIDKLWDGDETLIVVSSDLSHYHSYEKAKELDQKTADAIINLSPKDISYEQACGGSAIKGLLSVAKRKIMKANLIDLRNSGDTAGDKSRVVGYGAFHFYQ